MLCQHELQSWLTEDLLVRFDEKIVPLDTGVLLEWGLLAARLESKGKILPAMDSLMAATVLTHKFALVTRNVDDFNGADLEIINPWESD
jgi:predicted nucleic acid-binding protein